MDSIQDVVEALQVTNDPQASIVSEEDSQPALEPVNETGIVSIREPHSIDVDNNGETPLEAEPDIPLHSHSILSAGAAVENHEDTSIGGIEGADTALQQGLSFDLDEQHRGGPTEPVSVDELPTATLSPQTVLPPGITERADPCPNDMNTMNSPNISKSPSTGADDRADGMNCPICMEPWTGEGTHRICCLACGHLFGRSCIRRWLNQRGKKNSKCPHCNRKARIQDIRNLYVPSLTVIDDKSEQLLEEIQLLRSKNERLLLQNEKYRKHCQDLQALLTAPRPQDMSRNNETFFAKRSLNNLQESELKKQKTMQTYIMDAQKFQKACIVKGRNFNNRFELQEEFSVLGARVFDMDAHSQMLLVAQKSPAPNGAFNLNKISMLSLADTLMMPLPPCTGAVRDIRVAPPSGKLPGRLALVASLGKMISLFSLESNNVVLTYRLQSPCWSCAWDPNEPNYVFAGLQDGALNVFDLRQTSSPLGCLQSISRQPVHTVYPTNEWDSHQAKNRTGVLSACTSGICFWDMSIPHHPNNRPHAITCSNNSGVCVALAYNQLANMGIATFRNKPPALQSESIIQTTDVASNDPSLVSSQPHTQQHLGQTLLRACHYPLARSNHTSALQQDIQNGDGTLSCDNGSSMAWTYGNPMFGNVSPIGMNRSAIICSSWSENSSNLQTLFAFGDDETRALMLWDANSLTVVDRLKPHPSAILDVKSMNIGEHAILGCISSSTLQVYKR